MTRANAVQILMESPIYFRMTLEARRVAVDDFCRVYEEKLDEEKKAEDQKNAEH